ncbi:hypothetical protein GGR52DRAFT_557606 [Hypoxylon sp. FL1284]|nr:hypothetical protein GGR52DRAFT_557606 [Hypoxylon sp. FL1284]
MIKMLPIISFVGLLSSGKDALGRRLAREFELYYLSVADFFRFMCNDPFPRLLAEGVMRMFEGGQLIPMEEFQKVFASFPGVPPPVIDAAYLRQFEVLRKTLPPSIAIPLLENKIKEINNEFGYAHTHKGILLDGFPREMDHFRAAETINKSTELVIVLECPEKLGTSRYHRHANSEVISALSDRRREFECNVPDLVKEFRTRKMLVNVVRNSFMTDAEAYETLIQALSANEKWKAIIGPVYLPLF